MCLDVFLLEFILYWTLCASWTWLTISFPMLGRFSTILSLKNCAVPFFFSSSSGTSITQMLVCLILSQKCLKLSSIIFILFPLLWWSVTISTILSSSSLCHSSASVSLLLFPSRVFLASLVAQRLKAPASNAGDPGLIPGSGRSPGEGNGNPLQYSCLENPMDGET